MHSCKICFPTEQNAICWEIITVNYIVNKLISRPKRAPLMNLTIVTRAIVNLMKL